MCLNLPLYTGVVCGEGLSLNSKEPWEKNDWNGVGMSRSGIGIVPILTHYAGSDIGGEQEI